jgi:hypothetical protein
MKYLKGGWVEHPVEDWGKGVVLEDADGPTVTISFETVGIKTLDLRYVEPQIISAALASEEKIEQLKASSRLYFNESFLDIYRDIKISFPGHIVIIQNGFFFEALESDAEYLRSLFGWKIHARGNASVTGFPDQAVSVLKKLRSLQQPFAIVSQLPPQKTGKIERQITEIFDGKTAVTVEHDAQPQRVPKRYHGDTDDGVHSELVGSGDRKTSISMEFDREKARVLLKEFGASIEKPPGFNWKFGGDSWMQQVGNEFDRNRKKNAKFELSALVRSYLRDLRKASSDAASSKTITQAKKAISENDQFLIAVTLVLSSSTTTDLVSDLQEVLTAYRE